MKTNDTQDKVKRLTMEQIGFPNPRTFELIDGKFESAGSLRMEGPDGNAVEGRGDGLDCGK